LKVIGRIEESELGDSSFARDGRMAASSFGR
jgi:hypothetical protein